MLHIGCHLSSSAGFTAMAKTAISINANTFQFFLRNPRGGAAKDINKDDMYVLTGKLYPNILILDDLYTKSMLKG